MKPRENAGRMLASAAISQANATRKNYQITRDATRPEDLRATRAQLAQSESGRAEVQVTVDEGRQFSPVDGEISVKVYYIAALADFATWRSSQDLGGFDLRTFEVRGRPTEPVDGLRTATRHDRAH